MMNLLKQEGIQIMLLPQPVTQNIVGFRGTAPYIVSPHSQPWYSRLLVAPFAWPANCARYARAHGMS